MAGATAIARPLFPQLVVVGLGAAYGWGDGSDATAAKKGGVVRSRSAFEEGKAMKRARLQEKLARTAPGEAVSDEEGSDDDDDDEGEDGEGA